MKTDAENYENNVEQWLDDALAQYARIEPRPGMEKRLSARLAAEKDASNRKLRWWGALGFSTAAVLALALVWLGRPQSIQIPPSAVTKVDTPARVAAPAPTAAEPHAGRASDKRRYQHERSTESQTAQKLAQFPSPVPLTDQEKMLAHYVRNFPEKAALVARVQTDLRKRDELEMSEPWPKASLKERESF